ncbi:winged helix-turn-helix domain-containing protein [Arthrobacter sp. NPDC056727]|uniref:winged helix-turn-helix domain-containing protein n=1 Tax=Arthrobacter sp. NPDC056727 TaxID=3345927 RepID=UPI00367036A8
MPLDTTQPITSNELRGLSQADADTLILRASDKGPASYSRILKLKRSGPEPLYYQLAQSIEDAIQSGAIDHGTKLPPLSVMAAELTLSAQTVRHAWDYLERRGVLICRRGLGTVVS